MNNWLEHDTEHRTFAWKKSVRHRIITLLSKQIDNNCSFSDLLRRNKKMFFFISSYLDKKCCKCLFDNLISSKCLKSVQFSSEQTKEKQALADKAERPLLEAFLFSLLLWALTNSSFSNVCEILVNPFFILTFLKEFILFAETWPYSPDCLQMPVNGNIDGETGGFQEVGEEVPFDHPRLGDAHLFATYF